MLGRKAIRPLLCLLFAGGKCEGMERDDRFPGVLGLRGPGNSLKFSYGGSDVRPLAPFFVCFSQKVNAREWNAYPRTPHKTKVYALFPVGRHDEQSPDAATYRT